MEYREQPASNSAHHRLLREAHPTWDLAQRQRVISSFANSSYVATAWDDKLLIGTVRLISDGIGFGLIADLLVHPNYRKQGIASQLVKMCAVTHPELYLYADPGSAGLAPFYEQNGFVHHDIWRRPPQ